MVTINFTWRTMYKSIKYISLGLIRHSTDFFLLSKECSIYLQHFTVYCLKRSCFMCCSIFFEGRFIMLSFGSVVIIECIQKFCLVEMIGTNYFSSLLSSFMLLKVLGVSSVHWHSWVPHSWREQEEFSISFIPLKVDQIFTEGLCCFLDIQSWALTEGSHATCTLECDYPLQTHLSWEAPLGTLRFRSTQSQF